MNYDDSYLMHHGVKGMHWGVRRYRNYDGTLTPAGKAQRKKENRSSSVGSSGGKGMSAKTKKRLATAAKVAGAAAAVGGAAYLANRASGGQLAEAARNAGESFNKSSAGAKLRGAKVAAGVRASEARDAINNSSAANKLRGAKVSAGVRASEARDAFNKSSAGAKLRGAKVAAGVKASEARDRISNKLNAYEEKGQQVLDNRKYGNNKSGLKRASIDMKLSGGERARQAVGRVRDKASGIASNLREDARDFRNNPKQYISTSNAAVNARNLRDKVGKATSRAGMTVSGTARTARNLAGKSLSDTANRIGNSRVGKAASRAGMTVSGTARTARNLAGKSLSNARDRASNKFNAYAEKGQQVLDNKKYGNNKSGLKRASINMKLSGGERARQAAGRVRDRVAGAASTAKKTAGNVKNAARNTYRDTSTKVKNGANNSLVGQAAKAAYYRGTKSGRKQVYDRLFEADMRTAGRTVAQRRTAAKRQSVAEQHGGSVRAAKSKKKGRR